MSKKENNIIEVKLTVKQMKELEMKAKEGDAEANYKLCQACYKYGDLIEAKDYFEKTKGYEMSSDYLERIKNEQLQENLKDPKTAVEFFEQMNKNNSIQIQEAIESIDNKIEENSTTHLPSNSSPLIKEKDELNKNLNGIIQINKDTIKSEEWKKHASVLVSK